MCCLEHQPHLFMLFASLGNVYAADPIWYFIDPGRWWSQCHAGRGRAPTLPTLCDSEVCIWHEMSQLRWSVFLVRPLCVTIFCRVTRYYEFVGTLTKYRWMGLSTLFLKAGLGCVQTNVRIQWNLSPVFKVFHRIHLCGNERSGS